jgi:radical SAM superfamily enzyme YgiQ (UPF0313 family)
MDNKTIVLVKASTGSYRADEYSQDFEELKLSEPLALEYLKAYAEAKRRDWNVVIINPVLERLTARAVSNQVVHLNPFLVGISVTYQWQRGFALELSDLIKQKIPNAHIVLGGMYPTSDWANLLQLGKNNIDSVARGEGEETFLELADAVASGRQWQNISGLAYLHEERPISARLRRRITDLGSLPFPDRGQLSKVLELGGVIQVEASRGCNAGCTFCDMRHTGWVGRPVHHLVDEIELLATKNQGHKIWFIDNIFIGFDESRFERIQQLASEILRRGISLQFSFQDRAENVHKDIFHELKKAGLTTLFIGIESFADSALKRWRKGVSAEVNKNALRILKELEIFTKIGFIIFDDQTDMNEIWQNITTLREVGINNGFLHLYSLNELIPYAGTFLSTVYKEKYGKPLSLEDPEPWIFRDRRVRAFRDWSWHYSLSIWPVSELIFHNYDDSEFQSILPMFLPTKNRCLINYLEELYYQVTNNASEKELQGLCSAAVIDTKSALSAILKSCFSSKACSQMAKAISSIHIAECL